MFFNGQFVDERHAMLSVFDRGMLYGDAVFETAFVWNGYIFKLGRHLQRLEHSLRAVCIDLPMTRDELKLAIVETVRRNRLRNAYVKWIVTRGMGPGVLWIPQVVSRASLFRLGGPVAGGSCKGRGGNLRQDRQREANTARVHRSAHQEHKLPEPHPGENRSRERRL